LLAFHRGTLQVTLVDELAEHLESCLNCDAAIRELDRATDPLVDVMRKHARASSTVLSGRWTTRHAPGPGARRTHNGPDPTLREHWPALAGYEITGVLGRGGMGVVYLARHLALNRMVALKHLRAGSGAMAARSRREAEALAGLHHPNIVRIHEIVDRDGGLFLSLELIEGGSLDAFLLGKPQPPLETARLMEAVARAMAHAHTRGIIHRDLKPANILLSSEGREQYAAQSPPDKPTLGGFIPKIADFGLAKRLDAPGNATRDGDVIGTPSYMAPEQAAGKGETIGPAADIYAMGVILYEMVTGRVPLQGPSTLQTLVMVCEREPIPPRKIQPGLPRDLETICLKCLQKDPGRRYQDAGALAEDLRRFQAKEPIAARPTPIWERGWKWSRRRPTLAALLALSLAVVGIGFPLVLFLWLRADRALDQVSRSRNQLEHAVYADNIALAEHALDANQTGAARTFLDRCVPADGRPDLRGWEWGYLHRLGQADLLPGIGHTERPGFWANAVGFHPSGTFFVSAAGLPGGSVTGYPENAQEITPGEAKVWDINAGACLATLTRHHGSVQAAVFSPDGRWLATGAADGTVCLWDGATFASRSSLLHVGGVIKSLAFSPDSRALAIGSSLSVTLWDVTDHEHLAPCTLAQNDPGSTVTVAFNPRGDRLAAGRTCGATESGLKIWDPRTRTPIVHHLPPGPVSALAFSPDGRYLATADGTDRIYLWEADGSRLSRRLATHADGIAALVFCPDGRLVSAGEDRTVRTWDPRSWTLDAEYRGHELGILALAVSGDGMHLISADKLGAIKAWDLKRNPAGAKFNVFPGNGEYLGTLAFSDDGKHILDVTDLSDLPGHYLEIRDRATGSLERKIQLRPRAAGDNLHRIFAWSGNAGRLCGVDWADQELVRVYDTEGGSTIASVRARNANVAAIAMTRDGATLALSGWKSVESGTERVLSTDLSVHDVATGKMTGSLNLPTGHVATQLAFSPDGKRLATALRATDWQDGKLVPGPSARVSIWEPSARTGPKAVEILHQGPATCLAFSPDGSRLASVGVDRTLQMVDSHTGRAVLPPATDAGSATSVVFSPDGRRLAAAGMDGIVRLWDAAEGQPLLSLRGTAPAGGGHYGFTARVVFSPEGSRLASNDWDGTVTIWDASP
jgi:WD40 repeat protein/serine/threonine protein kinase